MTRQLREARVYLVLQFQRDKYPSEGRRKLGSSLGSWCNKLQNYILNCKNEAERANWELSMAFKTSKPFFSDIFPPEKPQILNLPKQHYLLWTKYLNAWDYGSISFKTSQKPPMLTQNLDTFFSFIELTRYEETENFRVHYRNWQPVL